MCAQFAKMTDLNNLNGNKFPKIVASPEQQSEIDSEDANNEMYVNLHKINSML